MLQKLTTAWQQQNNAASGLASAAPRENDTINLIKDERIIVTSIHDIYYAEAHEKMTFVYTRRESFVMPMNITESVSYTHLHLCQRTALPYVPERTLFNRRAGSVFRQ